MSDELFVDGVGEVVITGMVVRIDLVAFNTSDRNEQGRPKGEVRQRIVMPVDGFVRAVQTLGGTIGKLEEIGVIKKRSQDVDGEALAAAALSNAPDAG